MAKLDLALINSDEEWPARLIDKLPSDDDKDVFTKLLNECYKYSVAINNQAQEHPLASESLILALLLTQHKTHHSFKIKKIITGFTKYLRLT